MYQKCLNMKMFFNKHGPATNLPSIMHCLTNRNPKFPAAENLLGPGLNMRTPSQNARTNNKQICFCHQIQHLISSCHPIFFIISSHHQEGCQHRKQHGCVDLHNFLPFWDPWMTHHPFTPMPTEAPPFAAPSAPAVRWSSVAAACVRGWRRRCDLWVFPRRGSGYWLIG